MPLTELRAGEVASPTPATSAKQATSTFRIPPSPPDILVRRRLVALLRQGVRGPLTLLSAPAGYGKTALVTSWAGRGAETSTIVYARMDDGDASSVAFWASLLLGLRSSGVDVSGVRMSASSDLVDRATLMRLARAITAHEQPVVWVLDCGEHTLPPATGDGLHRVIDRCAGRLRVVLLTRTDPPLPLHRYRLEGLITEVRASDLAFTPAEVSPLMERVGLHLAPVDVAALQARTGGWPAGLKFAAMSLAGRADTEQAIEEFRGDTGNVAAFLMREVVATQPPEMREFLLRTCVVDEVDPGLVEALTGQRCDRRLLEFVAHGNSFIEPVPGSPAGYRYQSLFREFLRSELAYEQPALVPVLHLAAAEWFARNGQWLAAIRHALSAEEGATASRYFVDGLCLGGLLTGRTRTLMLGMFAQLPADLEGADAAVTRAALALVELDADRCAAELEWARACLDRDGPGRNQECALAIVVLSAVVASLGADLDAGLEAVLTAKNALQAVAVHEAAHRELRAVLAGCEGRLLLQRGDFATAHAAVCEGITAAESLDLAGEALAQLEGMAALVEAITGDSRRATERATRWEPEPGGKAGPGTPSTRAVTLALAWVRTDEYDLQAAWDLLGSAEEAAPSYDAKVLSAISALVRARLLRAQQEPQIARTVLRAARRTLSSRHAGGWLDRSLIAGQAVSLLEEGRPQEALAMVVGFEDGDRAELELVRQRASLASGGESTDLEAATSLATDADPLDLRVSRWLFLAGESLERNEVMEGEAFLDRALRLAAPQHLRRPFFEAPDIVRRRLERRDLTARHRWLLATAPPHSDDTGPGSLDESGPGRDDGDRTGETLVNPLTPKEHEVLGYLAELLTTEEIAQAMYVSVNTVRSHVRSILRKLGVARRNEAIRRAWELRLLPPHGPA